MQIDDILASYCAACERHFSSKAKKQNHVKLCHAGKEPTVPTPETLCDIVRNSKISDRTCPKCGEVYYSKQTCQRHIQRKHNGDGKQVTEPLTELSSMGTQNGTAGDPCSARATAEQGSGATEPNQPPPETRAPDGEKRLQSVLVHFYYSQ